MSCVSTGVVQPSQAVTFVASEKQAGFCGDVTSGLQEHGLGFRVWGSVNLDWETEQTNQDGMRDDMIAQHAGCKGTHVNSAAVQSTRCWLQSSLQKEFLSASNDFPNVLEQADGWAKHIYIQPCGMLTKSNHQQTLAAH